MYKLLLTVAILPALAMAITPVRECAGGGNMPASTTINDCTAMPCDLVHGAPLNAHATGIVSPISTNTLMTFVTVRLAGLEIPFPMPDGLEDACTAGTPAGTCPVAAGDVFDYSLVFEGEVLNLSGVTVQVEVGMRGDDGTLVGCLAFDARLVN